MKSYLYLVLHSPRTDWVDFCDEFMPAAQAAGIDVWVYLVPPTEGGPTSPFGPGEGYSAQAGYVRWAQEIAAQAVKYSRLRGFIMDDFNRNYATFTPYFVGSMMAKAHIICPRLAFQVVNYYRDITPLFVKKYANCIDGVIFPYTNLNSTAFLNGQIAAIHKLLQAQPAGTSSTPALPLTVMIYAWSTSWHAEAPTTAYITEALGIAYDNISAGRADGCVTYCLDKSTPTGADFTAVARLYSSWIGVRGMRIKE